MKHPINKILFCIVIILAILLFGPDVKALFVVKPTIEHLNRLPQNFYNPIEIRDCSYSHCKDAQMEIIRQAREARLDPQLMLDIAFCESSCLFPFLSILQLYFIEFPLQKPMNCSSVIEACIASIHSIPKGFLT